MNDAMETKMQKIYKFVGIILTLGVLFPATVFAATAPKSFTGTVTAIVGTQVVFNNGTAAIYKAEVISSSLVRKNGAAMKFSEILIGDKVEVKGTLWSDNSISASFLRDLSLYAHSASFSGKIISINPQDLSFVIQSTTNGTQTIYTNSLTTFKKNGSGSTFNNLELGMTAAVKGQWERSKANVVASSVTGTLRLISIDFTGNIYMTNENSITVVGNGNVIYGVDISKAKLQNKSGKTITLNKINGNDLVRVWGKHISGGVQVYATQVKDLSILK